MKKQIDLFRVLESGTDKARRVSLSPGARGLIVIATLLIVGFAAAAVMLTRDNAALLASRNELRDYVESEQNVARYNALSEMQKNTAENIAYVSLTQAVSGMMETTPRFDADVYRVILANKPAGVTLTGIEYAAGVITLSCVTSNNMPPSDFAGGLDASGEFSNVQYTGFSQMDEGKLQFTIVCQ